MFTDLKLADKTGEVIAAFYEVYNNLGYKPEFKRRFFSKQARDILNNKNPLNPRLKD